MPVFTDGLRLEPEDAGVDRYHASMGETLGAAAGEAFADSPMQQLLGISRLEAARGIDFTGIGSGGETEPVAPPTMVPIDAARARVKEAGLDKDLKLPDQDIAEPALSIMIDRARVRREREATMQRGPQGIVTDALSVGTSFLVGAIDPINIASAFIPVMGEARYAKLLANAGDSLVARSAIRAGVGGAQGAIGQAALEPLDWWSHTQDGRDFGMADVLRNVLFGAVLGGGLHAGGGAIGDTLRARRGEPVYPFGPGEPMADIPGRHVPGSILAEDGVTRDVLDPVAAAPAEPSPEVRLIDDLPQRAREDVARAGIASLIDGEPLRVGEMLEAAAKTDPRIAESFQVAAEPEVATTAPRRSLPARVFTGPIALETTPLYGKTVWHETSPVSAAALFREDVQNYTDGVQTSSIFVTDNKDLALGQGGKGVRLGFDGNLVSAVEHRKPGTGVLAGREYRTNAIGTRAISTIEVAPGVDFALRPLWGRKLDAEFDRADLPDGTVTYQRKQSAGVAPTGNPQIVLGSDAQRAAGDTIASRADAQPPPTDKIVLGADLQVASPALDGGRQDAAIKALGAAAGRLHKAEPGSNKARAAVEGVRAAEKKLRKEFGILSTEQIEAMGPDHPRARVEAERAGMVGEIENILGRDLPLAERGAVSGVDPTGTTPADPAALRARVSELVQQLRNGEGANAGRDTADLAQLGRGEQPDAGPAPRDGGADPRAGGAPGLPDDGTGRGAGTAARDDGGGPGPAGAGRLDRDAAWRDLAQARPEFDDPDVLQASRTAAAVPTPPTRLDERVAAAEKAQAFAKQMYDMFAERLPEQDRQRLDDVIKAIDDDHEARETAIVRGGGCLFGVV